MPSSAAAANPQGDDRLGRLRRAAASARRRLRHRAALARLALLAPLPLGYAAAALAATKAGRLGPDWQGRLLLGGVLLLTLVLGLTLLAWLRRPSRWAGARALDEHHALDDRLTTSLELSELAPAERSELTDMAIADGIDAARRLEPGRAVPIRVPAELGWSAALLVLLGFVSSLEIARARPPPPAPRHFEPLALAPDDIELFREMTQELETKLTDPTSLAATRRFNALVEDLAGARLDRAEAFRRLAELETELARAAEADREARELGLKGLSRELARSGMTRAAAEALEKQRLADAAEAQKKLAERLRNKQKPPTKAELQRLRDVLERASKASAERLLALEQQRRELTEEQQSLLKKKKDKPENAAETDAALERNRRRLERLDRDVERAERAQKEMSALDRALAKAAEDLMKDLGKAAEGVEQSAEDLNRMGKQEMSDAEKQKLLERLREMREVLRQQGQAGKERQRQMMRFSERARGRKPGESGEKGKGQPGQPGQLGKLEIVPVPRGATGATGAQGPGKAGERPSTGTQGDASAGTEPGHGHDGNVRGEQRTQLDATTREVAAAGVDSGQGSASAEVIHGAAERGFVGQGYRDVFVQYETVAEQALEHERIPPGYRFYVRRYFQLIRPRE